MSSTTLEPPSTPTNGVATVAATTAPRRHRAHASDTFCDTRCSARRYTRRHTRAAQSSIAFTHNTAGDAQGRCSSGQDLSSC